MENFDTLSEAIKALNQQGYRESFTAKPENILALYSKKTYQPEELKIVKEFRFEGMTNPGDSTGLFVIHANDGTKGTLVMSYGAQHSQNIELVKLIEKA